MTVEALQDIFCRGISIATSNHYLTAMKGFTRWLTKGTGKDPLATLARLNAKTDVRHGRRAMDVDGLRVLLNAASASPTMFLGLSGKDRAMLYALAMVTGFRAGELASLLPRSFDLAAEGPSVRGRAAYTKNRREAVQPLPPDVAEALRDYLAEKPTNVPVWPGAWVDQAAEMVRGDLEAAGLEYRDEDGLVFDFHALRHSYITLLERSGASPKMAQELARHSDIRLTMNVYTHTGLYDKAAAVDRLPGLLGVRQQEPIETLAATGTENPRPFDLVKAQSKAPELSTEVQDAKDTCGLLPGDFGSLCPGSNPGRVVSYSPPRIAGNTIPRIPTFRAKVWATEFRAVGFSSRRRLQSRFRAAWAVRSRGIQNARICPRRAFGGQNRGKEGRQRPKRGRRGQCACRPAWSNECHCGGPVPGPPLGSPRSWKAV